MKKTIAFILAAVILCCCVYAASSRQPFKDVPVGAWYEKAVAWAYECGITNGVDDTHFAPDKPITRAELVTMLFRMNKTINDMPYQPPSPNPTIHPDYALDYVGRLYIGNYSVGLYDTLDQELVDKSDAAFIMKRQDGCFMIGDHDSEGLWIIRWCGNGDQMQIIKEDGSIQTFQWARTDVHGTNVGYDVLDNNGNSAFKQGHDVFIATCNDSEGRDVTVVFWDEVQP